MQKKVLNGLQKEKNYSRKKENLAWEWVVGGGVKILQYRYDLRVIILSRLGDLDVMQVPPMKNCMHVLLFCRIFLWSSSQHYSDLLQQILFNSVDFKNVCDIVAFKTKLTLNKT